MAIAYVNDWTQKQIDAELADAVAHGANRAEVDKLRQSWEYMLRLNSTKEFTTTFKTLYVTQGEQPRALPRNIQAYGYGGIIGAAQGLIAKGPVLLGERTVPEAAIPAPNSGISQGRADALLGTAASWWGRKLMPAGRIGGGVTINVNVNAGMGTNGHDVGDQVAQVIMRKLRTDPAFASVFGLS